MSASELPLNQAAAATPAADEGVDEEAEAAVLQLKLDAIVARLLQKVDVSLASRCEGGGGEARGMFVGCCFWW